MKRALTGIRPSGDLHLGNYLGTMRPALELQSSYECFFFIADLHSLTTTRDPQIIRAATYDITAAWIACGLDLKSNILYRQSDLPQVTELSWYLSCVTGLGLIEKAHAYKDAAANNKEVNHGVFAYPVLMAADILMYAPDLVPVGKDQKQHVEMARDMAGSLNALYGKDLLKLPEPLIREEVMVIPGLDGRKMSKSYQNVIPLFAEEKALRKLIMSIKTDSTAVEAPKTLSGTLIGDLLVHFASKAQFEDLAKRLAAGGLGWGHAKEELFVVINNYLKDKRQQYVALRADTAALDKILAAGAAKAWEVGKPVLSRIREALGLPKIAA